MSRKYSLKLDKLAEKDPARAEMLRKHVESLNEVSEIPDEELDNVAGGSCFEHKPINVYICFFGCKFHRSTGETIEIPPNGTITLEQYKQYMDEGFIMDGGSLLEDDFVELQFEG